MRLKLKIALVIAALASGIGGSAHAQSAWPGVPLPSMVGDDRALAMHFFPSKPTSVAVDAWIVNTLLVVDVVPDFAGITLDNAQVFSNRAALDVFNNDQVYAVSPYDVGNDFWYGAADRNPCDEGTLVLRWKPAGADCTANPDSCPYTFNHVGGEACHVALRERWSSFTYATTTNAGQGIDDKVMSYYSRRGQLPIRWQQISRGPSTKGTEDTNALLFRVYQYKSGLAWPHVSCVVETTINPQSILPSFQLCSGN